MTSNSRTGSNPLAPTSWSRRIPPRTVLAVLGLLAICELGFYLLAVLPVAHRERERRIRNEELAAQVEQSQRGIATVRAAADRIETADVEGRALVQQIALPRRTAFSALLTELGVAAQQAGVEIRETSYSVEAIEGSDEYGILAVNANFRGNYDNLVQLLYQLDRSELFFIIGSLGATPREEDNSRGLQINMRFDTLVRDL